MMRLRPRRSARSEEKGETSRAKRAVDEVMMDLSREVRSRCDSDVSMETRVAEMTPVSSAWEKGADQSQSAWNRTCVRQRQAWQRASGRTYNQREAR